MLRQLSAFSGLAMAIIVLVHAFDMGTGIPLELGYAPAPSWNRYLMAGVHLLGTYAVPVFLLVSGSFIAYAARTKSHIRLSWSFVINSLRRILFPYALWSAIFYALVVLNGSQELSLVQYVKNIIVGYPFHFIPFLVFFYLISPLVVRSVARWPLATLVAFLALQAFLIIAQESTFIGMTIPGWVQALVPPVLGPRYADWGIFVPLGMVFSLHTSDVKSILTRLRRPIVIFTIVSFLFGGLYLFGIIQVSYPRLLLPLSFAFCIPLVGRKSFPLVRTFERLGKHAYGIYLTHMITQYLILLASAALVPRIFDFRVPLYVILYVAGLGLPLLLMRQFESEQLRGLYHYVFG